MAAFFGQAIVETSWFTTMKEGAGEQAKYAPWFGRGFLQLTNSDGSSDLEKSNYYCYFRWRGRFPEHASQSQIEQWRDMLITQPDDASQSAGFYWIQPKFGNPDHCAERASWYAETPNENLRVAAGGHAYYSNESARKVAAYVNVPGSIYKPEKYKVNNVPERYSCYANALVILADAPNFQQKGGRNAETPDDFELREPW